MVPKCPKCVPLNPSPTAAFHLLISLNLLLNTTFDHLSLLLSVVHYEGGASTLCNPLPNLDGYSIMSATMANTYVSGQSQANSVHLPDVKTGVWTELRLVHALKIEPFQQHTGGSGIPSKAHPSSAFLQKHLHLLQLLSSDHLEMTYLSSPSLSSSMSTSTSLQALSSLITRSNLFTGKASRNSWAEWA